MEFGNSLAVARARLNHERSTPTVRLTQGLGGGRTVDAASRSDAVWSEGRNVASRIRLESWVWEVGTLRECPPNWSFGAAAGVGRGPLGERFLDRFSAEDRGDFVAPMMVIG